MSRPAFHPTPDQLPETLPVFPLTGVLLLPGGRLPLNVFEPRYLNMVQDALKDPQRLIGMIQPSEPESLQEKPALQKIGCAGRIGAFQETDDGRILINLTGVIRFRIADEIETLRGYRRIVPDYEGFAHDLDCYEDAASFDKDRLIAALGPYFRLKGIDADPDSLDSCCDGTLVTTLAMSCPFSAQEKQALLEYGTLSERADALSTIMEMAVRETGSPPSTTRQ
jgi:Lon protease-like protein